MPVLGCTNPNAVNFNPSATEDDGSCVYLIKKGDECLRFEELEEQENKSFTLSFSLFNQAWVFFHDYQPDFYVHTRNDLYALSGRSLFKTNEGSPGNYGFGTKPFFVDIAFPYGIEALLDSIQWLSEIHDKPYKTITHISAWNSTQHSGRITVIDILDNLEFKNVQKSKAEWTISLLRSVIKESGVDFLESLFNNFALKSSQTTVLPWYEQAILEDNYVVVRLEFDNSSGDTIFIHDSDLTLTPTTT
jgi:hypothetical protein